MRLVHDQHEVVQASQIVEVALADVLGEPLDARRLAAAHLGVDLRDVEDVDLAADVSSNRRPGFPLVVVAGDDVGGVVANSEMPLKTYFGVFGVKSAISLL